MKSTEIKKIYFGIMILFCIISAFITGWLFIENWQIFIFGETTNDNNIEINDNRYPRIRTIEEFLNSMKNIMIIVLKSPLVQILIWIILCIAMSSMFERLIDEEKVRNDKSQ